MKPSIPTGTRDFLPREVMRRRYIFDTIRSVFVKYGYQPIETPTMEELSTLTGKYGEEGDKLLFKVLNNGDYLANVDERLLENRSSNALTPQISKRGLRYDLTVPFARFVVMHQNDLPFPFKRYQIQPVWRADKPQRGRYREFYQCDVDVVGSNSLVYEAELTQIYDEVFAQLGISVIIRINNRKVLYGMAEAAGIPDQFVPMTMAIDKLDKVGMAGVKAEMERRGIPTTAIDKIEAILQVKTLEDLGPYFADSETGKEGIEELKTFYEYLGTYTPTNEVRFDVTLARGLDYYTGCIFEVEANKANYPKLKMGSIGGGGRYDNLTGVFGLNGVSGVGVSFGAERIYDVMEQLELFPTEQKEALQLLFIAFDAKAHLYAFRCLNEIRKAGINAELYPEPVKLKKQMKYANNRQVPFVVLVGDKEMETGELALKDMNSGEQTGLPLEAIIEQLKGNS